MVFFLEIPTFPFLLFYLVTQISLQSLFLPNDHLSPTYFPQIYLVPYFSRRQMILISTPIMQIQLLVYIHWKICTVNIHSFFQMLRKVMKWEITSFSTSQDIHKTPPNPLTLWSVIWFSRTEAAKYWKRIRARAHPQPWETQTPKAAKRLVLRLGVENQKQILSGSPKKHRDFACISKCGKEQCSRKRDKMFSKLLSLMVQQ